MGSFADFLPIRVIRGIFRGLEDGMRGDIDTNEKFSDGERENDRSKKSAAGSFLSDYAGIRGGARTGEFIGKWGGGLGCAALTATVVGNIATAGLAAGAMVGLWPVLSIGVLALGAGVVGGALLGVAGRYVGGAVGAIVGGLAGPLVGAYNALFRRGYYAKDKQPDIEMPAPDVQQPEVAVPEVAAPDVVPQVGQGMPDMSRAMQQAQAQINTQALLGQSGATGQQQPASTQAVAAKSSVQQSGPSAQQSGFAQRVRESAEQSNTHSQANRR